MTPQNINENTITDGLPIFIFNISSRTIPVIPAGTMLMKMLISILVLKTSFSLSFIAMRMDASVPRWRIAISGSSRFCPVICDNRRRCPELDTGRSSVAP